MPQKDTADPKTAQELRAFNRKWVERYSKHDAAALAALFTDDAVQVAPEGLILRSAIFAVFRGDYSLETLPSPPWDQSAYALWSPNRHGFHDLIPQVTATSCARLHINLWLMHGKRPSKEQSVTVTRVQYKQL
jgi:hypothetical protein